MLNLDSIQDGQQSQNKERGIIGIIRDQRWKSGGGFYFHVIRMKPHQHNLMVGTSPSKDLLQALAQARRHLSLNIFQLN